MSRLKTELWKIICVAVLVPGLMALAMPVRALMVDKPSDATTAAAVGSDQAKTIAAESELIDEDSPIFTLAKAETGSPAPGNMPDGKMVALPDNGSSTVSAATGEKTDNMQSAQDASPNFMGQEQTTWWSGMNTTKKAALLGAPVAASAVAGFAIGGGSSTTTREASPLVPAEN